MRSEFYDGMALPTSATGFRAESGHCLYCVHLGWYLGVVLTDATFVKLVKDLMKPKN